MEFTVDYAEIGRNISLFREQKGWSQSKLAEKTGLSVQHISNVVRGTVVSLPALLSICYALGADANSIVGANLPNTVKVAHLNQLLGILAAKQFDVGVLEQIVLLVKQIQALQSGEST